ncbi:MAG: alpha/beta hydrolase [Sphingomonadales bacterium]|nr:alpha/beta hydrolase [Sphingomonadales bacterium]MDE2169756.1 alpha/beta hydrolase [Sphingomonadales bacterium]
MATGKAMHKTIRMAMTFGAVLLASAAAAQTPAEDRAALTAQYTLPGSKFVEIDGQPIHYMDEGKGPAIMLVHGSFASLRQWNDWAAKLRRHYRVIRFDMPPAGLSGRSPLGDHGPERQVAIIEGLRRKLGVGTMLLVATSSGAVPGAAYAATHGEHLSGFIFNNGAVGPLKLDASKFPEALKRAVAQDASHKGYHEEDYWRQILLYNIEDKSKVTTALVREWTDLNNRALQLQADAPVTAPPHERTSDDLTHIHVPTLFLWSAQDHEVTVAGDATRGMSLLAARDKALVVVPRCGHMMPLDCSDRALADAMPFIRRVAR